MLPPPPAFVNSSIGTGQPGRALSPSVPAAPSVASLRHLCASWVSHGGFGDPRPLSDVSSAMPRGSAQERGAEGQTPRRPPQSAGSCRARSASHGSRLSVLSAWG